MRWHIFKMDPSHWRESKLGDKNPNWKGNSVGYHGLHAWIKRNKPKIGLCENCKASKSIDLANISGLYLRNCNDFEWLCRSCHMKKDGRLENLHNKKRGVLY